MIYETRNNILIGLAGKAGVGKTTTAEWFVKEHDFVRLSFAMPLKEGLSAMTGLAIGHFTDIELKEKDIPGLPGVTPRKLMQWCGTEFIREMVDPGFWLWRMRHMISEYSNRDIIIDDIRFPNESEFVRANGGQVIHLERNFDPVTKENNHTSEELETFGEGDIKIKSLESVELTALRISSLIL